MKEPGNIREEILELKARLNAVILVHNYQPGELQEIGDIVGDSLDLSRAAARTDADVILFCGVHFMAETAAILSPQKTVLIPDRDAGCAMADTVSPEALARLKAMHPDAATVCYVNSTAAVKAICDVCCTSSNAVKVVESLPANQEVIFVPDRFLGSYVEKATGRRMILWPGQCPVHASITAADIDRMRRHLPGAEIWAHPECMPEVSEMADLVLSTGGMVKQAARTNSRAVVVATEIGMLYRLRKERPDVMFAPATEQAICVDMKKTGLKSVRDALVEKKNVVSIPDDVRRAAAAAVKRMLSIG